LAAEGAEKGLPAGDSHPNHETKVADSESAHEVRTGAPIKGASASKSTNDANKSKSKKPEEDEDKEAQLVIMKVEVPAKNWAPKSFQCKVIVSNKADHEVRGEVRLKKIPLTNNDDKCLSVEALESICEVISQREKWGKAGSAEDTREITFSIPSGVFTRGTGEGIRYRILAEAESFEESKTSKNPDRVYSRPFKVGWLPAINLTDINVIMAFALFGVFLMMAGTLVFESDPRNRSVLARDEFPMGAQLVTVERPNLIVPIKYGFLPIQERIDDFFGVKYEKERENAGNITVTIYGSNSTILDVAVGPVSNSTLNPVSIYPHIRDIDETGPIPVVKYNFPFKVTHRGYVYNSTDSYAVTIVGLKQVSEERSNGNSTDMVTQGVPFPRNLEFSWNIRTMDFPPMMYFWLVLTGVIFSRYITFQSDVTADETHARQYRELLTRGAKKNPALWLIFSAVITLLVFGGFQDQLKYLTTNILVNLSIAFAFGFGFDKVLESTKKIPT
jgi:hypothetical protein